MSLLRRLYPLLFIAALVLLFSFGIMLLFYILLASFVISFVLFAVNWVKMRFFQPRQTLKKPQTKTGRIIDTDDYRHL
jgi:predicted membrane protein